MRRRTAIGLAAAAGVATAAVVASRRDRADDLPLPDVSGTALTVQTSDGAVIAVHVAGDGPWVVLPHCWMGSMAVWSRVAAVLVERGYRVVRYDQRGHGESTVGSDGCTVERLGTDLLEVLEAVDARDAVLAGHSMGGITIQSFGIRHPDARRERVRGVVFVSTSAAERSRDPLNELAPRLLRQPTVDRVLATRRGPMFVRGALGARPRPTDLAVTRDGVLSTPPAVRLDFLSSMKATDHRPWLAGFETPSVVLVGSRDTLTPPSVARVLAAALPDARVVTVPSAGHMLPLENPGVIADHIVAAHTAPAAEPTARTARAGLGGRPAAPTRSGPLS
jgi:pimeloyl-ACP methyl ester carboxylesterase